MVLEVHQSAVNAPRMMIIDYGAGPEYSPRPVFFDLPLDQGFTDEVADGLRAILMALLLISASKFSSREGSKETPTLSTVMVAPWHQDRVTLLIFLLPKVFNMRWAFIMIILLLISCYGSEEICIFQTV